MGQCVHTSAKDILHKLGQCVKTIGYMFSASLDTLAHEQMGQCVQTSGKEIFDKLDQCVKTIAYIFSATLDTLAQFSQSANIVTMCLN